MTIMWIPVENGVPNNREQVLGMRADGWWGKVTYENDGWRSWYGSAQAIVKWVRVNKEST